MKKMNERIKDFVRKNKWHIIKTSLMALFGCIVALISYIFGYNKGEDAGIDAANDWTMKEHMKFLDSMAPNIGTPYVIKRLDEINGVTIGEFFDREDEIKELRDLVSSQKDIISTLKEAR